MISRRSLLLNGSIALAGGAIAATVATQKSPAPAAVSASPWDEVRKQFNVSPDFTHLSLFFLASHPKPVRDALESYRRKLDENPLLTVEHALFEGGDGNLTMRTTGALSTYIGAKPEDIALTQNTTMGLSLLYHGLQLQPGDEILSTTHDHMVHHEAIRLAAERNGATTRRISLFDSFDAISADEIVERIRKGIGPKTRVVGITWVHSSSGLKLPLKRIADAVAEVNANRAQKVLLFVDGVHGIGVEDPHIVATGIDAFAAGTHKWLFAPRGTGFVWAKPEVWASLRPLIPTFGAFEIFDAWARQVKPAGPPRGNWFSPGGFQAYEHYWAVPAAVEFHRALGAARVTERIHSLNEQVKNELAKMPHVKLYTPRSRELSAGMVCFDVRNMAQTAVVETLLKKHRILASTTPYPVSYARVVFGLQNNEAEVEKTVKAIAELG
jgi:selenocysteine lyase/cysteine desulfurase